MKKEVTLEYIKSIKNIDELTSLQQALNEACEERRVVLNVNDEANNLEFPSYLFIKESFENMADKLFTSKKGRKLIGRYIREHKNNKELSKLFHIYENISKADKTINTITLIQEMKNMVGNINDEKLNKGVESLKAIIRESYKVIGVEAKNLLSENTNNDICQYVDYVFKNDVKIDNVVKYNKCINEIKNHIDKNSVSGVQFTSVNVNNIDEAYKRYNEILSEDNVIIKEIKESANKQDVFEKYKAECLAVLEQSIKTDIDQASCDKLFEFKTKIMNKTYNEETLGLDIANFIELKETIKQ